MGGAPWPDAKRYRSERCAARSAGRRHERRRTGAPTPCAWRRDSSPHAWQPPSGSWASQGWPEGCDNWGAADPADPAAVPPVADWASAPPASAPSASVCDASVCDAGAPALDLVAPAPVVRSAVRFVVEDQGGLPRPSRLRVVGDSDELGEWDPHYGIDLFYEGGRWTSSLLALPCEKWFTFCLLDVHDPPRLGDVHPRYAQEARRFEWGPRQAFQSPGEGQVSEVALSRALHTKVPPVWISAKSALLAFSPENRLVQSQPAASQRCYTFEAANGVALDFCLYLPPGYGEAGQGWPLLVYLHAMHGRLHGDINIFFESEAPPQLLQGDDRCPDLLRERFVVLSPQCPVDADRAHGNGIWLRRGWFEESTYMPEVEDALVALIDGVVEHCSIDRDRISISGSSMGGYASLELAGRRPGLFAACAPVASHYEFDMDALVASLTQQQELPLWFFHSTNDSLCPYETIETLVGRLRGQSRAEVRMTTFEDTWSSSGHSSDRVSYHRVPCADRQPAHGSELFAWILAQRRRNRDT